MPQSSAEAAAQREYYQRSNGPVVGGDPTYKKQPNKLLKQYQKHGHIPQHFKSWEEINEAFKELVEVQGLSEETAREQIGITRRNPNNKPIISLYDRYEKGNYINARNINEDWNPDAEDRVRRIKGDDAVEQERLRQRDTWGDNKTRVAESPYGPPVPNARDDAQRVQRKMSENTGLEIDPYDRGRQVHRGHGNSASGSGAGVDRANVDPEWGPINVDGHAGVAGNPRFHPDTMADLNMPGTTDAAYWNKQLEDAGLTITPRSMSQAGDYMAADEGQEVFGRKGNGDYVVGPSKDPVRQPPETIAARQDLRYQLQQQGVPGARAQADGQSTLLETTDATPQSGPVKTNRTHTTVQDQTPKANGKLPRPRVSVQVPDPRTRPLTQLRKAAKGVSKIVPGPIDDLAIGAGVTAVVGAASLLGGAGPVQAAEDAGNTAVDFATGDLDGGSLAPGTVTGQKHLEDQNPNYYGKQGPSVTTPAQSQRAAQLQVNPEGERGYETLGRGLQWGVQKLQELFIR